MSTDVTPGPMGIQRAPEYGDRTPVQTRERLRRLGSRLLSASALVVILSIVVAVLQSWWIRGELGIARQEIVRKAWSSALSRLKIISRAPLVLQSDEVDFLVGLCEWQTGNRQEAIKAFRRVSPGSHFDAPAASFEAEELLMRWQFRAAEERLLRILRPAQKGQGTILSMLTRLGRMEARFDEVRTWLRSGFVEADDPIGLLRQLWLIDRGVAPSEGIRENLEHALKRNSDDERIWLGLGRVAILEGRFQEAADWLRRCRNRSPDDSAVILAWLDLGREEGKVDQVESILNGSVWDKFNYAERLAWKAWLARSIGSIEAERSALERWLEFEPYNPEALELLGTLLMKCGHAERAAELRRRKRDVDEALNSYRTRISGNGSFATVAERVEMARLAEAAGRPFDARAWCTLATRLDPNALGIASIVARLERTETLHAEELANVAAPGRVGATSSGPSKPPASQARLEFRDDAEAAELRFAFDNGESKIHQLPEMLSGGVGLIDYDGDGWLDVYCVQGGAFPSGSAPQSNVDRLFRNRGNGTFEDVSKTSGIAGLAHGYGHGVAVGDYDNDGHPDLFITRWRAYALYHNKGNGTFEEATSAAGLSGDRDWPTSAAFADLDGDGDLDLYVCHYLRWDADNPRVCRDSQSGSYGSCNARDFPAQPDHLFRNDQGRFVDVTAKAGITDKFGRGLGVVATDLDGDDKLDLFVANDQSANYLFHNLGSLRFEEVGHSCGVAANAHGGYQAGMGTACGDFDGDGRQDLVVTNFYGESTSIYHNLGGGLFCDRTAFSGLAIPSRYLLGFGAAFLDANNDGHLDLITANGHLDPLPGTPYKMPVQLLLGDGARFFAPTVTARDALSVPRIGRAMAVGDIDNDGRLDALVLDHKAPLAYLHNQSTGGGHFLVLRLEGTRCNRDAVGARVSVTAGGYHRFAWRFGGGSYQSASDSRMHLGLGSADRIDRLEVVWPSGVAQQFTHLAADRGYLLREGEAAVSPLPGFSRRANEISPALSPR